MTPGELTTKRTGINATEKYSGLSYINTHKHNL